MSVTLAPPPQEHPAIYRAAHQLAHQQSDVPCPRCEKAEMDLLVRGIHYCKHCKVTWTPEDLAEAQAEAQAEPEACYDDWRPGYFEDLRRGIKGAGGGGSGKGRGKDKSGGKKFDGSHDEWWLTPEEQQAQADATSKRIATRSVSFSFRLSTERKLELQQQAASEGISFSDLLRKTLMDFARKELNSYRESVDRDSMPVVG